MKAFRAAPWYLNLLQITLPLILCLKITGLAMFIQTLSDTPRTLSISGLAIDFSFLTLIAAAVWGVWHPRRIFRWVVAAFFLAMLCQMIYFQLYPRAPILPKPEVTDRDIQSWISFLMSVLALWWISACIFGRRAREFFDV